MIRKLQFCQTKWLRICLTLLFSSLTQNFIKMKRTLILLGIAAAILVSACKKDNSTPSVTVTGDSLAPGTGYANDIYYSFTNGVVASVSRTNWDLAFSTPARTASILINDGNGVQLFTWKGGVAANFNNVDTSAINDVVESSSLTNDNLDTTWYNSAFEQNIVASNPYDAGWGIYNATTHNVEGDSVYILKLADGTYKKVVVLLHSGTSPYPFVIKIADLVKNAVADSVTITATQYSTKNFVYYSVANKSIIDREPANSTWDVLFTKYWDRTDGQPVGGFLTNEGISSAKLSGADTTKTYNQATYSKVIGNIGYDWKHFNGSSYDIVAGRYYYIKTKDNHYYSLKFKSFNLTTRVTKFEKKLLK